MDGKSCRASRHECAHDPVPHSRIRSLARETLLSFGHPGSLTLLVDSAEAYAAWLSAIEHAQSEIFLEMYWFADDAIGVRFGEALGAAASRGVNVKLIVDAFGSAGTSVGFFERLRERGVAVEFFHPFSFLRNVSLRGFLVRDHRKLLIVDESTAFVGGINICMPAAPIDMGGEGWHDNAVKVTGSAVITLRHLFLQTWGYLRKEGFRSTDELIDDGVVTLFSKGNPKSELFQPPFVSHGVRRVYSDRIKQARTRIYIANAYFIPDPSIRRALRKAAMRGVDVRILLPLQSDLEHVRLASSAMLGSLLRCGVRVFQYPLRILHSKTAVIDEWATVGSYNLDYQSLRFNLELNVATEEPSFVRRLSEEFDKDFAVSKELDLDEWEKRPFFSKAKERLFYQFRNFL